MKTQKRSFEERLTNFKYRPRIPYAALRDEVLLYFLGLLRDRMAVLVYPIIIRDNPVFPFLPQKGKWEFLEKGFLPFIIRLHKDGVGEKLLWQLVRLKLEEFALYREYERRMASRPVGHELLHPSGVERLQKLLKVDQLTTYRPQKEDSEDLRGLALQKAYEEYDKQAEALVSTPTKETPSLPLREAASWDAQYEARWDREVKPALRRLLPVLLGTSEGIPSKVRQHMRVYWKQWKAMKRTGEEVDLQEGQRIIRREGKLKDSFEEFDKRADVSARMFQVLKEAKKHKRWGPQFINFAKYYLQGKSEEEAARLAKITDRTARNHIAKLRKIFALKK